jgi:vacuolar-type H+-ATPase subunit I/STV1
MNDKKTSEILEKISSLDRNLQNQIKEKEIKIKILETEIEQLYYLINKIQYLGEVVNK